MSWFRLDDQGAFHAKVVKAGNEAYGAWCRAGQWSACHGQDGRVPRAIAITIAPTRIWTRLLEVGLLEVNLEDGGGPGSEFQIHDYLEWNLSAAELEAKRSARSQAGSRGGRRSVENRQAAAKQTPSNCLSKDEASGQANEKQSSTPAPAPAPAPIPEEKIYLSNQKQKRARSANDTSAPDGAGSSGDGESSVLRPPEPLQLLPTEPDGPKAPTPTEQVFEAYLSGWRGAKRSGRAPLLSPKRRALIATRLRDGFTPEQLAAAARGIWLEPWHRERGHTELELALRDAGHVERFAQVSERPPPKRDQRGHPMQSGGPDFAPEDA
jgi:hypothetical protein